MGDGEGEVEEERPARVLSDEPQGLLHETLLHGAFPALVEEIGGAADVFPADIDLRNGGLARAVQEHGADLPAQVVLLIGH